MKFLESSGLVGQNLFPVDTPEFVKRYNDCLEYMGIDKTSLVKFKIDKKGWSPEIAQEKRDDFYLSHGTANGMGIILSIEQNKASLYFPYYSFDDFLMDKVFTERHKEIIDTTTTTGICLDMENGISRFNNPHDLLMINSFQVKFNTPLNISEKSKNQKNLVIELEDSDVNWMDDEFRQIIINEVKENGDLRFRNITLAEINYNELSIFFTRMFGGIFVIRDEESDDIDDCLVISVEDNEWSKVQNLYSKKMLEKLINKGFLSVDLEYYRNNVKKIKLMMEYILAEFVCHKFTDIDFFKLSKGKKKKYINEFKDELPSIFFELETLISDLKTNRKIKLSNDLKIKLARVDEWASKNHKYAMNTLLTYLDPVDVLRLYRNNKTKFYYDYRDWPESKQKWASAFIVEEYISKKIGVNNDWYYIMACSLLSFSCSLLSLWYEARYYFKKSQNILA